MKNILIIISIAALTLIASLAGTRYISTSENTKGGVTAISDQPMTVQEFAAAIPMAVGVKDKKGIQYSTKVKDVSKYGLTDEETKFVGEILAGNGPTGQGAVSVQDIGMLYYTTALKMGLTAGDILNGVNLYEFIRK